MARSKTPGVARKSTGGKAPKKRLGTQPVRKLGRKPAGVGPRSSAEANGEVGCSSKERGVWRPEFKVDGKPLPEDISLLKDPKAAEAVMRGLVSPGDWPFLKKLSVTDLRAALSQHYASVGCYTTALMEWYETTITKERDMVLKELKESGEEVKEVQKELCKCKAELEKSWQDRDSYKERLEAGKKEWEAERIAVSERLKDYFQRQVDKEEENAYCRGYLDGWFKDPHAYVLATMVGHVVKLKANELTQLTLPHPLPDEHTPMEALSSVS